MPPKDDPETAALKKELDDLTAKLKVCNSSFCLKNAQIFNGKSLISV